MNFYKLLILNNILQYILIFILIFASDSFCPILVTHDQRINGCAQECMGKFSNRCIYCRAILPAPQVSSSTMMVTEIMTAMGTISGRKN